MSPAYAAVRHQFIAELRAFAENGERELSFLVDADTGEVIDRQEGELDEVTPDWSKAQAGQRVVALHSHPNLGGPGGEDWDVLCLQLQVIRLEIVDVEAIYIIEKPDDWEFQKALTEAARTQSLLTGKWVSPAQALFDRTLHDVRHDALWAIQDKSSQIEETNRRMPRWVFFRDFQFSKEAFAP